MPHGKLPSVKSGGSANLDLLRSIAVLLVLAQHLCRRLHVFQVGWMATSSWGAFGVLLFFVHTSLVLLHSMGRSQLNGRALLHNFYLRRIFRIYPLSILAVLTALTLRLDSDVNGTAGLSRSPFPGMVVSAANLLLVQNLLYAKSIVNVLWSLPFELQMYLFLPFLFLWIRGRRMFWPLLGLWITSVVAGVIQPHVPGLGRLSILLFVPNFLPGVIAFSLVRRPRLPAFVWPIFIMFLVVGFTLRPVAAVGWVLCLFLGVLIPFFAEITIPWVCALSNRIAT